MMIAAGTEKCGVNEPDSVRRAGMSVGANAFEICPTRVTCSPSQELCTVCILFSILCNSGQITEPLTVSISLFI